MSKRRTDIDEEERDGETVDAHLSHKKNKLKRKSDNLDDDLDHQNDNGSDDDQPARKKSRKDKGKEPMTADMDLDNNETIDADVDDEEEENPRKYGGVKQQFAKGMKKGGEALFGVIESIILQNFMCHDYVTVNLGPKLNFVIGHNGSGKSAILTAITVCLGGKATFTNRASSVKDLIKEGKNTGQVTIRIRNRGPEAYKPNIFGPSITIVRKLSRDNSGGGYKIKSHADKVISTRKEDLESICDHMGIQVDNPMNILTQDTAKQFLAKSTPEDLYQFFCQGTQLQQMSQDYQLIDEEVKMMRSTIEFKRKALPDLKTEFRRYEQLWDDVQSSQNLESELEELKKQIAWAQIVELEKAVHESERDTQRSDKKFEKYNEAVNNAQEKLNESKRTKAQLAEQLAVKKQESTPFAERMAEIRRQTSELDREINSIETKKSELNQSVRMAKRSIDQLDVRISEEQAKLEQNSRAVRETRERYIKELEEQMAELKREFEETRGQGEAVDIELGQKEAQFKESQEQIRRLQEEIRRTETNIKQMQNQKRNRLAAFGDKMPQVIAEIERLANQGKWKGAKPIGPLGMYVQVTEPRWQKIIESILGANLNGFGVENQEDLKLLQGILARNRLNGVPVFRYRHQDFNFSSGEPSRSFLTIYRAIQVEHPVVLRQLVINNSVEKIILVEHRAEANRIATSGPNRTLPHNVTACYTLDGYNVGHRGGGNSTQTVNFWRGAPRLSRDVDKNIGDSTLALQQLKQQLQVLEAEGRDLKMLIDGLRRQSQQLKNKARELNRRVGNKDMEIKELNDEMVIEDPVNLAAMEEEKANFQREKDLLLNQFTDAEARIAELRARKKEIRRAADESKDVGLRLKQEIESLETDIENIDQRIENESREVEHYTKKADEVRASIATAQAEYEARQNLLQEQTAKAASYCERVEVNKSIAWLEKAIQRLEQKIKENERQYGNRETVFQAYIAKRDAYVKAKTDIVMCDRLCAALHHALLARTNRWAQFHKHIGWRASHLFLSNLQQRGYSGKLRVDSSHHRLDLSVQIDDQKKARKGGGGKDTRALSGGEKSFSTICLLLSLWEMMGCPIRCLDEFDVFMDPVNRRISMKLLMDSCRDTSGVQYVLISPQDMSHIHGMGQDDNVRVIKMADPERGGQTRLHDHFE